MNPILLAKMNPQTIGFSQSVFIPGLSPEESMQKLKAEKENLKSADFFLAKEAKTKQFNSGATQANITVPGFMILWQHINISLNKALQLSSSPVGWANRIALTVIYVWFGLFKIMKQSPAQELVADLHKATFVHFIPINIFLLMLGIGECFIGALWLFPKLTRVTFVIFIIHIATTFLPLFFLQNETWTAAYVLSLQGQYIVKNVVLIACAVSILVDYKTKQRVTDKKTITSFI